MAQFEGLSSIGYSTEFKQFILGLSVISNESPFRFLSLTIKAIL